MYFPTYILVLRSNRFAIRLKQCKIDMLKQNVLGCTNLEI